MRYRVPKSHSGTTRKNLEKFHKHFNRLGEIKTVSGYKVVTYEKCSNGDVFPVVSPRLMITDTEGRKMRLNGVLWGYMGEGPRGTIEVLKSCGLCEKQSEMIVTTQDSNYYQMSEEKRKFERVFTVDFFKKTFPMALDISKN